MRRLTLGLLGLAASLAVSQPASAQFWYDPLDEEPMQYLGPQPRYDARPQQAPTGARTVSFPAQYSPGMIVISTQARRLYYVTGRGQAIEYAVGVGRPGFDWKGTKTITRKAEWPSWRPPAAMLKRRPDLPTYMSGGVNNPLGARALYLGSSLYRIHGSNEPDTIGQAVSSGCIRMTNEDVIDLYRRVRVGTRVVVM
ncbi:L,D-transpeptidase [Enterovirga rhinocerotis]|uniref:Lipoprotein-anchoring transpeptidase ErfK/SrfK n=1 Tax=Enterovirga rhinocerotis TaxID=1339210 RepID=A0A4R7BZ17_9HYPH|nr:L,D-transpeptidase [Enterovirga rhinocerotis]TDR89306.1 lipoprotein-anchoring transpeptidase ErfK/SrfK [Enterovirga rhinocerotis]